MSLTSRMVQESCKLEVARKLQELSTDALLVEMHSNDICWEARTPRSPYLTEMYAGCLGRYSNCSQSTIEFGGSSSWLDCKDS